MVSRARISEVVTGVYTHHLEPNLVLPAFGYTSPIVHSPSEYYKRLPSGINRLSSSLDAHLICYAYYLHDLMSQRT